MNPHTLVAAEAAFATDPAAGWDGLDIGVLRLDGDARIRFANRWLIAHAGPAAVAAGEPLDTAFGGQVGPALVSAVRQCLRDGHASRLAPALHPRLLPLQRPGQADGERLWLVIDVLRTDARPRDGDAGCWVMVRDTTDAVRREQRLLARSRQLDDTLSRLTRAARTVEHHRVRLRSVARLMGAGLFETDADGLLTHADARAGELLGAGFTAALGRRWTTGLGCGDTEAQARFARWAATAVRGEAHADVWSPRRGAGDAPALQIDAVPLRNDLGDLLGHLFVVRPADAATPTGLAPSPAAPLPPAGATTAAPQGLDAVLEAALARLRAGGRTPVLMRVAVARTPPAAGGDRRDEVAARIASRLRRCVREGDRVLRLASDQFAVVLHQVPDAGVAERVAQQVDRALRLPVVTPEGSVRLHASVAHAVPPPGATVDDWRRVADAALEGAVAMRRAAVAARGAGDGRPG